MNAIEYIQTKQQIWAKSQGINLIGSKGDRGKKIYTTALNENLFLPMNSTVKQAFDEGDGNELNQYDGFPAKMQALHYQIDISDKKSPATSDTPHRALTSK